MTVEIRIGIFYSIAQERKKATKAEAREKRKNKIPKAEKKRKIADEQLELARAGMFGIEFKPVTL